ncbi:MAG: prolipoprotein diacylglyceryl transferase [Actinobacteria bacterium]|nr:prolipoprotein diacylglyceryl transferase [Actinomycetota bacterium]
MNAPDPIAFSIGIIKIRWYGILIALALLLGILISYFIAKYRRQRPEEVINLTPLIVIFGVIGARLLHVFVNWPYYSQNLSYIFAFRRGGLAIQGAMLGGVIALIVFCRIRKLNFWLWTDILAPSLILGQAIGRWGNFFNQEAFGLPTSKKWGIFIDPANRPSHYSNSQYFMPTFFYEFLANIVLFAILLLLHRQYKKYPDRFPYGLVFCTYLAVYSVYRSIIESFRIDSSYFLGVKVVYIIDGLTVIAALIIASYLIKRFRREKIRQEMEKPEKI